MNLNNLISEHKAITTALKCLWQLGARIPVKQFDFGAEDQLATERQHAGARSCIFAGCPVFSSRLWMTASFWAALLDNSVQGAVSVISEPETSDKVIHRLDLNCHLSLNVLNICSSQWNPLPGSGCFGTASQTLTCASPQWWCSEDLLPMQILLILPHQHHSSNQSNRPPADNQ